MTEFKNNIINKIKSGEVEMIPRWHFMLRATLLAISVIILALVSIYFLSFILFVFHQTGLWFTPSFGTFGLVFFVVSSPWIIISFVGLFLFTLYILVRQYSFSYQKPLVYSMIGIVLFVIGVASFIQQTTMHERIGQFVEERQVPGMAPLYRGYTGELPPGVIVGSVTSLEDDVLMLETTDGEDVRVLIDAYTKLPRNGTFTVGEHVFVLGEHHNGVIEARGIRPLGDDRRFQKPLRDERFHGGMMQY